MRYVELFRHTDNDGDSLTPEGIAAAEAIGRERLSPPYAFFGSTGAHRTEPPRGFRTLRFVSVPGRDETVSCSVVGGLDFGRCQIVDRFVGPLVVEPVDPVQGPDLDVFDVAPWPFGSDQLGFVPADLGLGQGAVVGISHGSDRWIDAGSMRSSRRPVPAEGRPVLHVGVLAPALHAWQMDQER